MWLEGGVKGVARESAKNSWLEWQGGCLMLWDAAYICTYD